jgi:hypothetical protein
MGLFDAIKDLIGGTGVADLAEKVGLGDHLDGIVEGVQAPIEELGAVPEQVGDAVAPVTEAVAPITDAADAAGPLLP